MGFLTDGNTLPWHEARKWADYIRKHGGIQLLHLYAANKNRTLDPFKWGDEIEYILVKFDAIHRTVRVSLRGPDVLDELQHDERQLLEQKPDASKPPAPLTALWRPEYGAFMVEGTPAAPYTDAIEQLLGVESNMARRRSTLQAHLHADEVPLTITVFPLLGVGWCAEPHAGPRGPIAESLFVSDNVIHPHRRFATLTENIRRRRGSRVAINVPLFRDRRTDLSVGCSLPALADKSALADAQPAHIYMDAMAFGMGCCCLQVTLQAADLDQARCLFDQFVPLAPVLLALTAASPIFRGLLADVDVRWNVIAQSVDDRTPTERGLRLSDVQQPHQQLPQVSADAIPPQIRKSRYDSVDYYISPRASPAYNDAEPEINRTAYEQLIAGGCDEVLARHVAHLFIRDPLVIYDSKIELEDATRSDHFENLQSTNWQTVRFKPPPPATPEVGWRVEVRPMEVQLTDFENAAFALFVVLLARAVVALELSFYVPISRVEQNMATAHQRDAARQGKFHWRTNVHKAGAKSPLLSAGSRTSSGGSASALTGESEYTLLSVDEIINGKPGVFDGLLPLVRHYVCTHVAPHSSAAQLTQLERYLSHVQARAAGQLLTPASYLRQLVLSHPDYQANSVVSQPIAFDVLNTVREIGEGKLRPPELLLP